MFVIARDDNWFWSKKDYWTIVPSKIKTFNSEKRAVNFMNKNGMADRIVNKVEVREKWL
jgi:hypothetical protein